MRIRVKQGEFSVHAIAGTNVVLFGMDLSRRPPDRSCWGSGSSGSTTSRRLMRGGR